MARPRRRITQMVSVFCAVIAMSLWFFGDTGYGEVSQETYRFATALYSACLAKDDSRIETIEQLLSANRGGEDPIDEKEYRWLVQILGKAKNGKWEIAAGMAKRMMNEQVQQVVE